MFGVGGGGVLLAYKLPPPNCDYAFNPKLETAFLLFLFSVTFNFNIFEYQKAF